MGSQARRAADGRALVVSAVAALALVWPPGPAAGVPIPWKNCGMAGDVVSVTKADASRWPPVGTPAPLLGTATFDPATGALARLRVVLFLGPELLFETAPGPGPIAADGFVSLPASVPMTLLGLPLPAGPYSTNKTYLSTVPGAEPLTVATSANVGSDVTAVVATLSLTHEGRPGFPIPPAAGLYTARLEIDRPSGEGILCVDMALAGAAFIGGVPLPFGGLRTAARRTVGDNVALAWDYTDGAGAAIDSPAAQPQVLVRPCGTGLSDNVAARSANVAGARYEPGERLWRFAWATGGLAAGCYGVSVRSGLTGQLDGPVTLLLTPAQPVVATGAGEGGTPHVRVFDATTGAPVAGPLGSFHADDPAFTGGVRVAVGDVDGDGVPDVVTGAGPGGGSRVRVFGGAAGGPGPALLASFDAFEPGLADGIFVAVGQCDGQPRLLVGAGVGGPPRVTVFGSTTSEPLGAFDAHDPGFTGGVRVASGDVDGDGCDDVITGAGPGGGPHVQVFSGRNGALLGGFHAFDPGFSGGVFVAAGDVDGDGQADVITGSGGGVPHLKVISGRDGSTLASLSGDDPRFAGGVRVASVDLDGDGRADLIVGAGPGSGPHVPIVDGATLHLVGSFDAYDPGFAGGVFVAAGR